MNSAIFTGGWEQLLAALIGGMLLVCWIDPQTGGGWTRWRVAAFFVGWQAFTPIQPWYVDLPLLIVCTLVMEGAYRIVSRCYVRSSRA